MASSGPSPSRRLCSPTSAAALPDRCHVPTFQRSSVRGGARRGCGKVSVSDLVTITGIAAGGDGVGRLADGRAVFVPRTAPGDRITLKDGSLKLLRNFGRAALGEVAGAGLRRVPAPAYVIRRAARREASDRGRRTAPHRQTRRGGPRDRRGGRGMALSREDLHGGESGNRG